jgi:molybdopterin/thiamine biosynthesis adenylyltransferase
MGKEVEFLKSDEKPESSSVASIYDEQIFELAEIRNPKLSSEELDEQIIKNLKEEIARVYIYFPWRNVVLETVPEEIFLEIKTNRNQLLITSKEQKKLYFDTTISVAGMSVGSSILYGLVGTGISRNIIISDFDDFSTSNLNRVQATILDVGSNKAEVAKRKALEMNPFLKIKTINKPITEENTDEFITDDTSIIFEEIDDFKMKVKLRKYAKNKKKAYVMLTNLGDGALIDIERHDIEEIDIFNGKVETDIIDEIEKSNEINSNLMKKLSVSLVDRDMISERAINTLNEIGNTLVGRPQLYSTVALDGGIAPYIARRILVGPDLKSGRYKLDLKDSF